MTATDDITSEDLDSRACVNHPEAFEGVLYCTRCGRRFCPDCLVMLWSRFFCGECKQEFVKDVVSGVDWYSLELASAGRRFVAIFLDGLVIMMPVMLVLFGFMGVTALTGGSQDENAMFAGMMFIVLLGLVPWAASVVYEALMLQWRGQTLGKIAMRIKVVRPDGGAISKGQAWGRAIVRNLLISYLALINYLPAFFTKERTCVHDMAAKTRVVNWD